MTPELIAVHPVVAWQRVDADRLQVRVPTGQHITFDRHSDFIESLLHTLKRPQTPESLRAHYPALDASSLSEVLEFMRFMVIVAPVRADHSSWLLEDMMDYYARLTQVARIGIADPYLREIAVLGDGALARLTREIATHPAVASVLGPAGTCLRVACADREDLPSLRAANRDAVQAGHAITFVYWTGSHLVVGPLVVPGQSSCLECLITRRISASKHFDELRALLEKPPSAATEEPRLDPMIEGLLRFAVGRHLSAAGRGLFQAAQPGHVEQWDPVEGSRHVSRVAKLPRCNVCGRNAGGMPPRAVRDFL